MTRGSRLALLIAAVVIIVVLRRRRVYDVPGVGRVLKASPQEHDCWREVYRERE